MTTLALYSQEISEIDNAIALLAEQMAFYKQQKKAIAYQQKLASKAMKAIATAKEALSQTAFAQLINAIASLNEVGSRKSEVGSVGQPAADEDDSELSAFDKSSLVLQSSGKEQQLSEDNAEGDSKLPTSDFRLPTSEGELIEQPQTENDSNEYFAFQPTFNPTVASYFNISTGLVQSTYIGGNNKTTLQSWIVAIGELLPGIVVELRKAKRMSDFKYELKIRHLNDDDIGWLTGFDFCETPTKQLECPIWSIKRLKADREAYAVIRHVDGERHAIGSIALNEHDLWTANLANGSPIGYVFETTVEAAGAVRQHYLKSVVEVEAIAA